jgi:hypothetical protein
MHRISVHLELCPKTTAAKASALVHRRDATASDAQRSSKELSRKSGGAGVSNEGSLKTLLQEYFTPDCYFPMRSANAGMMPFCRFLA